VHQRRTGPSTADPQKRLKPLIRKTQPYSKRIAHKGIWVEPKLPFFKGLREDL
jgi:bifunctional non-homologous end joining protein LigD